MPFINQNTKEINIKIVYYGAGLSGKTTNLQYIYDKTADNAKGKLIHLSGENERTLFFDFLPLDAGEMRGFKTRFHLYTVPGQSFYDVAAKFILKGVDGIVFVVDSERERQDANDGCYEGLKQNLENQEYDFSRIPMVIQYNKRDRSNALPVSELSKRFQFSHGQNRSIPEFEAVANKGIGVYETFDEISKLVLMDLKGAH